MNKWTRRTVLATGGLLGGGLALGVAGIAFAPNRLRVTPDSRDGTPQLTTWVKIGADNTVSVVIPHCEMGTGVHTALAMMCAEELEADWNLVRFEEAPGTDDYANGYLVRVFVPVVAAIPKYMERGIDFWTFKLTEMMDLQVTGGSSAVRGTGHLGMRVAGAAAKSMLLEAAANEWKVPVEECTAKLSRVTHSGSGRSATFGELAPQAALLKPPVHPPLKSRDSYTIVGKPTRRIDIPSKVNGSATYGVDVTLPDMVYATIAAAPVFGAKLVSVDTAPAEALPGVQKVVKLDNAVAVVADGYWRALKGLRALAPKFEQTGNEQVTSDTIYAAIVASIDDKEHHQEVFTSGKGSEALQGAAKVVEAEYRVPFLAHATMEPMNATARIADGRCEVWTGVQDPLGARKTAAEVSGLKPEQVTIHNQQLGGGFGRRLPGVMDFIEQAVRIAKETSPAPVKLIWSREEDIQHDFYRPAVVGRYKAALGDDGKPSAWVSKFNIKDAAAALPYGIEHQDIRAVEAPTHVRVGAWRSVAHTQHGFFTESFVDELAHAAGKDPLAYRRELLAHAPRHLAALEKAAAMADWSTPPAAGRGRGIALVESFGSIVAEVAEVEIVDGRVKVHRVCAAVDCGDVINPDTATAQVEGGIVFALSAALFNEVTIAGGRVAQSNFHDVPMPKLADAPSISVEFIRSGATLGGLGEPGVPPLAPAVANAVFALTGKRVRTLPLRV
ncbi:MAG TPA: molybdopterin cofactor-binding domain-containing protein [Steroidobacteraceae bacterium]|nr:molybdopterin cofactor-binding domain-containing protein [Steroidobacteraceae bacterium]